MKKIVFITVAFLLTLNVLGQEVVNNFKAENNELLWQRVYQTTLSFDQIAEEVKKSGIFENIEVTDNKLMGVTKPIEADFKGAGFSEMMAPIFVARSFFEGFSIIDFKDGKYRVTLKKIMMTQKYDDPLTKQGEKSSLESYGLKRGKNEMTNLFLKSPSLILDYTFSRKFEFKINQESDNW